MRGENEPFPFSNEAFLAGSSQVIFLWMLPLKKIQMSSFQNVKKEYLNLESDNVFSNIGFFFEATSSKNILILGIMAWLVIS